jgi:hypothetical protein
MAARKTQQKRLRLPPDRAVVERMMKTKNLPEPGDEFHVGGRKCCFLTMTL